MNDWHHAPIHRFEGGGTFFVTGATYLKQHFFARSASLDLLRENLFALAQDHMCWLQAWCLLSNHYHVVFNCENEAQAKGMLSRFHSESAIALNNVEGLKGRRVWYQFWDKTLTFEASWLARLRYTHENAVHHGIVDNAMNYRWCSASAFADNAPSGFRKAVYQMKIDRINVYDDFDTKAVALPPQS